MDGMRRTLLRVMGVGAGLMPAVAWAERIRILPGEPSAGGPASGGPSGATATGQVSPAFQRFVAGIRVGEARAHGGLQVLWLYTTDAVEPLAVATLEEARTRGHLLITEREQASVPDLVIENRGKSYVLLLAGEILVGGKQHRVLREDILLPPLSGPRAIGVYCVEQGRWEAGRKDFDAKGTFAAPGLRSRLMERADQGRVWAEVGKYAARAAAPSPTSSYQAVYEQPEVKEHLKDVERAPAHRPPGGALGAAVFVGATLTGLDLFHEPGLFAREWPKLLRAHALEAYRRPPGPNPDERTLRARLELILGGARRAEGSLRGNAGVGQLFEFHVEKGRGSALVFEGRTLHAAIL